MAMTDLDRVRLEIGDNRAPMHFTDDEINLKIAQHGTWQLAAADLCRLWATYLMTRPDFQVGEFRESGFREAAEMLLRRADELELQVATEPGAYAGGISVADKQAYEADTDRRPLAFKRGKFDNPDAGW